MQFCTIDFFLHKFAKSWIIQLPLAALQLHFISRIGYKEKNSISVYDNGRNYSKITWDPCYIWTRLKRLSVSKAAPIWINLFWFELIYFYLHQFAALFCFDFHQFTLIFINLFWFVSIYFDLCQYTLIYINLLSFASIYFDLLYQFSFFFQKVLGQKKQSLEGLR